jgi:aspartate aminotransferase-like enzyme
MLWNKGRGPIRLMMTTGPVDLSPRVLQALSRQQTYPYSKGFIDFFAETTEKMKKIFQTKNDVLILQGEGVLGLEAAVANTIDPGDKVLVLDSGPFGKWFGEYVVNFGGQVSEISVEYNDAIDPGKLKEKLDTEKNIKAMTVVHCETPVGILNPIRELCLLAKKEGILTIVDAVASLGGVDVRPDDWGIDICISASQKAISSAPGLTMMSMSPYSWEVIERKKKPIKNSYLSLTDWRETWIKNKRFPLTPTISEMYALGEAADELLEEGLQNSLTRHRAAAEECRKGVEKLGMKLWPRRREICSDTVTAIEVPDGYTDIEIINTMVEKYGVLIGGGRVGPKGPLLRIGTMGYTASITNVLTTLGVMERTLKELKKS